MTFVKLFVDEPELLDNPHVAEWLKDTERKVNEQMSKMLQRELNGWWIETDAWRRWVQE